MCGVRLGMQLVVIDVTGVRTNVDFLVIITMVVIVIVVVVHLSSVFPLWLFLLLRSSIPAVFLAVAGLSRRAAGAVRARVAWLPRYPGTTAFPLGPSLPFVALGAPDARFALFASFPLYSSRPRIPRCTVDARISRRPGRAFRAAVSCFPVVTRSSLEPDRPAGTRQTLVAGISSRPRSAAEAADAGFACLAVRSLLPDVPWLAVDARSPARAHLSRSALGPLGASLASGPVGSSAADRSRFSRSARSPITPVRSRFALVTRQTPFALFALFSWFARHSSGSLVALFSRWSCENRQRTNI